VNNDLVMMSDKLDDATLQKLKDKQKLETLDSCRDDLKTQNEQLMDDINTLVQQNFELNQGLNQMNDEIQYLRLREKKLKYLIHLLHERGYPVH
jgi:archaellum component FlaC